MSTPREMWDAVTIGNIPDTAHGKAVAGYTDGHFVNFRLLLARFFPGTRCVSIGIEPTTLAEFLDVEPGNPVRTTAGVRASFELRKAHGVFRPGFYADRSDMLTIVIPALSGIPREEYRLWVAWPEWNGPTVPEGFDAVQDALGVPPGFDHSFLLPDFFPPAKPPHRRPRKPHPKVIGSTIGGALGIVISALVHQAGAHVTPAEASAISTVLAMLAGHATPLRKAKRV